MEHLEGGQPAKVIHTLVLGIRDPGIGILIESLEHRLKQRPAHGMVHFVSEQEGLLVEQGAVVVLEGVGEEASVLDVEGGGGLFGDVRGGARAVVAAFKGVGVDYPRCLVDHHSPAALLAQTVGPVLVRHVLQ
jgi:hypothetical protein